MTDISYAEIDIILNKCIELHISYKSQVNFDINDKKQAFYLLQGAAITVTTLELVRANFTSLSHDCDYGHKNTKDLGMSIQLFAQRHLVDCIASLLITADTLYVAKDIYDDLKQDSQRIQGKIA